MRDEHDHPAAVEGPDASRKLGSPTRTGPRLAHRDDEHGVVSERPEDLDLLLHRERQRPARPVRRHLEAGAGETRRNRSRSSPRRTNPKRRGSAPRNTFSATVRCGTSEPPGQPSRSRAQAPRVAIRSPPARRARAAHPGPAKHAGDDLAEGGFAGSVLADEGVNGAGANSTHTSCRARVPPNDLPTPRMSRWTSPGAMWPSAGLVSPATPRA